MLFLTKPKPLGVKMDTLHFASILKMQEMHKRFTSIVDSNDELSGTVVIHMVCEKILETWIEACTYNKSFFGDSLNLTFANKLKIAKNFSFPLDCYTFMKTLNSIRNKFAHQIDKTTISSQEIDDLYNSFASFIEKNPQLDPKKMTVHTKKVSYNFSHSNNVRLSIFYSCIVLILMKNNLD